jgi:hypothetical protein
LMSLSMALPYNNVLVFNILALVYLHWDWKLFICNLSIIIFPHHEPSWLCFSIIVNASHVTFSIWMILCFKNSVVPFFVPDNLGNWIKHPLLS